MIEWPLTPKQQADGGAAFLARHPGAVLPSSFGENVDAGFDVAWHEDFTISRGIQMGRAWQDYLDDVERVTGQKFTNPYRGGAASYMSVGPEMAPGSAPPERSDPRAAEARAESDTHDRIRALLPKHPTLTLHTPEEIKAGVREKSRKVREAAALVSAGASTWGDIGYGIGSMGVILDPPNLASMLIGPGAGAGLFRAMAVNAGVGLGVETLNQVSHVYPWKRELGLKYTWGDALTNALFAGAGAGLFTGAVGAAAYPVRWLFNALGPGSEGRAAAIASEEARRHVSTNPLQSPREAAVADEPLRIRVTRADEPVPAPAESGAPAKLDAEMAHDTAAIAADSALRGERPLGEALAEIAAATRDFQAGGTHSARVDIREIGIDPKRFQFRSDANAAGVTDRLAHVKSWSDVLADMLLLWQERGGKLWASDGHHRVDLGQRLMREGHSPISVNALILREADGFTAQQAMLFAASKNVVGERATLFDAAKMFRLIESDRALAAWARDHLPPFPPNSKLYRDARALARLAPEPWGLVLNKVVPDNHAAIVGALIADPAQQLAALKALARATPDNEAQARFLVEDVRASGFIAAEQTDMFGTVLAVESLAPARSKVLDAALKEIRKDKAAFARVAAEADRLAEAGNVIDRVKSTERALSDAELLQTVATLATRKGAVSDALTAAAREFEQGARLGEAARRFLDALKRGEGANAGDGAPARGAGTGDAPGRDAEAGRQDVGAAPAGEPGARQYVKLGNREFVAAGDGTPNFGAIDAAIAAAIGREAGPIRLPKGDQFKGEVHINRPERMRDLSAAGYPDAAAFVADMARNFREVWPGDRRSISLTRPRAPDLVDVLYVNLEPATDGKGWNVRSAGIFRREHFEKSKGEPLWSGERTPAGGADHRPPYSSDPTNRTENSVEAGTDRGTARDQSDDANIGAPSLFDNATRRGIPTDPAERAAMARDMADAADTAAARAGGDQPEVVAAQRSIELDGDFTLRTEIKRADGAIEERTVSAKELLEEGKRKEDAAETVRQCVLGLKGDAK